MKILAELYKEYHAVTGVTQAELAEKADLGAATVQRLLDSDSESGKACNFLTLHSIMVAALPGYIDSISPAGAKVAARCRALAATLESDFSAPLKGSFLREFLDTFEKAGSDFLKFREENE